MNKSQSLHHKCRAAFLLAFLLFPLLLAACAGGERSGDPVCPPCPECPGARTAPEIPSAPPPSPPLQAARWEDLPGWNEEDASAAWSALLASCRALEKKDDWRKPCAAARAMPSSPPPASAEARRFLETWFAPYRAVAPDGATQGLMTGYYEPLLNGARQRGGPYRYPVLGAPDDLLTIELGEAVPSLKGQRLRGRLSGNRIVPYWSRAEIVANENDARRFTPLFWVDDPVELFFLQVQGSGRIRLPSGEIARVGYADQNGHPYRSIGRLLVEWGELKLEEAGMQGIREWAARQAETHPEKLAELLNANPSYVFFRELAATGNEEGPPGALGMPLTPGRSMAVDPRYIPLGSPVFIDTTWPNTDTPLRRLMLAQDTGGAIKGVVRADFFWGFGPEAANQAGKMRQPLRMWVLLPR